MFDPAPGVTTLPISEDLRRSHRSSLERLANSTSPRFAVFGAAALAIFNAGQSAQQKVPAGLLPRPAPELRP